MSSADTPAAAGALGLRSAAAEGKAPSAAEPFLQLERLEESLRYEDFAHDTEDMEDHTFCGIMVDLICSSRLPCEYVEVHSVWVRGDLGPLSVYTADESYTDIQNDASAWTLRYQGNHKPSFNALVELKLEPPKRIMAGERAGLYVHSTSDDDQAIVYDDRHYSRYCDDEAEGPGDENFTHQSNPRNPVLKISIGQAHLSSKPFGGRSPWGGEPWRHQREFVGRISYGVRWMLWMPELHKRFPLGFRRAAEAMLMGAKHPESPLYNLRDEVIFYILNRCGWDWFGTTFPRATLPSEEDPGSEKYRESRRMMDGFLAHAVHLPRQMMGGPRSLLHLLNSLGMHPIHVNARGEEVWGPEADSDDDEEEEPYIPLDNIEEGADSDEDEDGSDGGSHCHSWAADAVVDEEEGNFSGV